MAYRAVIVGTGFSGLCMAIRLKQAGIDSFVVLEKAASLGGTWRDNDYPGAACDVQSHLYSFSFEKNPNWSRAFAGQAEIRAYLEACATRYDVRRHVRFNAEVVGARYDEGRCIWAVTLASGEEVEADLLVSATGGLSRPRLPDIPGLERFEGRLFHSARWDHDYDLSGKTVGVIGTGASAIQFVPHVAARAAKVHLVQRTPPWILPKPDRAIGAVERFLYRLLPLLQALHRFLLYCLLELRVLGFAVDPKLMKFPESAARRYLERSVPDPVLRAKLTPNYTIGCKRILMSNDYFDAVQRPNVDVVDTGVREVRGDGLVTRDGAFLRLDALILGTGFTAAESVAPFPIIGRDGRDLSSSWRDGAEAHLGTMVAGFPNLFFLFGPNTGLGHSSMVYMIESQVAYVMDCIRAMRDRTARWVEVREDEQRSFNEWVQTRLARSVWASGCTSWYQTSSGKNTTLWPTFTFTFRRMTRRLSVAHHAFGSAHSSARPREQAAPANSASGVAGSA